MAQHRGENGASDDLRRRGCDYFYSDPNSPGALFRWERDLAPPLASLPSCKEVFSPEPGAWSRAAQLPIAPTHRTHTISSPALRAEREGDPGRLNIKGLENGATSGEKMEPARNGVKKWGQSELN